MQLGLALHVLCWIALIRYAYGILHTPLILDRRVLRDDQPAFGGIPDSLSSVTPTTSLSTTALSTTSLSTSVIPTALLPISWLPNLLFRLPEMRQVTVTRDVVFREVGRTRLRADIYRPRIASPTPLPTIVYIHGGGWVSGTRKQSRFMMYELAAAGYVVIALSYRFVWRTSLYRGVEDCKAGLVWAKQETARYGGDPDDVTIIGCSAGGHLAALLALTPNVPNLQRGFEDADTTVKAAVIFYGVPDFEGIIRERRNVGLAVLLQSLVFRGKLDHKLERFRELQPVNWISPQAPPMLLIHGQQDQLVPFDESVRFHRRLVEGGVRAHLLEVPHGFHAFEMFPTPLHLRAVKVVLEFLRTRPRELRAGNEDPPTHQGEA
jgi:acetyl esterase/lipase